MGYSCAFKLPQLTISKTTTLPIIADETWWCPKCTCMKAWFQLRAAGWRWGAPIWANAAHTHGTFTRLLLCNNRFLLPPFIKSNLMRTNTSFPRNLSKKVASYSQKYKLGNSPWSSTYIRPNYFVCYVTCVSQTGLHKPKHHTPCKRHEFGFHSESLISMKVKCKRFIS